MIDPNSLFLNGITFDHALNPIAKGDLIAVQYYPVLIGEEDTEQVLDEKANAYGVYLVFGEDCHDRHNPTEWIGDLDTLSAAEGFARMVGALAGVPVYQYAEVEIFCTTTQP